MYTYKYSWATSVPTAVRGNASQQYTSPNRQVAQITYRGAQYLCLSVWNLLQSIIRESWTLIWLLDFWKIYGLLNLASCKNEFFFNTKRRLDG